REGSGRGPACGCPWAPIAPGKVLPTNGSARSPPPVSPPVATPPYRNVRDGPYELTAEQERNRTSRWPKLF
ncbi:MAG: hypothetical protein ACKPB8_02650, partial [Alphaproteobacteria bacterium]